MCSPGSEDMGMELEKEPLIPAGKFILLFSRMQLLNSFCSLKTSYFLYEQNLEPGLLYTRNSELDELCILGFLGRSYIKFKSNLLEQLPFWKMNVS